MGTTIIYFMLSALFVDFVGYWLHRWSHVKNSPIFRPHMTHHLKQYPPQRVLSDHYKSSGPDGLTIWFAPAGVIYLATILIAGFEHPVAMIVGGAVSATLSSLLHDLTHLQSSIVWRWKFLKGIAIRHHSHHFKMKRNFGIIIPTWDYLFGTRKS